MKTDEEKEATSRTILLSIGLAVLVGGLSLAASMAAPDSRALVWYVLAFGLLSAAAVIAWRAPHSGSVYAPALAGVVIGSGASIDLVGGRAVPEVLVLGITAAMSLFTALIARRSGRPLLLVLAAYTGGLLCAVAGPWAVALFVPILLGATYGSGWVTTKAALAPALLTVPVGCIRLLDAEPEVPGAIIGGAVALAVTLLVTHVDPVVVKSERDLMRSPIRMAERDGSAIFQGSVFGWSAVWLTAWTMGEVAPVPHVIAVAMIAAALFLPGGGVRPNAGRDWQVIIGVLLLGLTLSVGTINAEVESLIAVGLAIIAQFVYLVQPGRELAYRVTAAVVAYLAARWAREGVWGMSETFLNDPWATAQAAMLGLLGLVLILVKGRRTDQLADFVRFIAGLFLLAHVIVLVPAYIGQALGQFDAAIPIGQALVSVVWLLCGAALVWRPGNRSAQASLAIGVAIAIAATVKLVLFDLSALQGWVRVLAFVASGVILILTAVLRPRQAAAPWPPTGTR